MPAEGGAPKRLTFTATLTRDDVFRPHGADNIVIGWQNDGKQILFARACARSTTSSASSLPCRSTAAWRGVCRCRAAGSRRIRPTTRSCVQPRLPRVPHLEALPWRHGRRCLDFNDFETKKTENITDNEAQDIIPMWNGNKIYFLSDRDELKRMNLYVYDLAKRRHGN